jgi:hypothetical protein
MMSSHWTFIKHGLTLLLADKVIGNYKLATRVRHAAVRATAI